MRRPTDRGPRYNLLYHTASQVVWGFSMGVVFGAAYLVTVTVRGQRPALSGVVTVVASSACVFTLWTLAVSAPGWVLVWAGAAALGLATGLAQPLPSLRRTAV